MSNITSNTTIINGTVHTQNIISLDNNGSCSNSPNYCQDGYLLYVPCLKNITRGQNLCFQMYVADRSTQDTLDLNNMCGMTLETTGVFGCPYGTYTYPDDIIPLQREEIGDIRCKVFEGDTYRLDVAYLEYLPNLKNVNEYGVDKLNIDDSALNVNVVGTYGDFHKGETPYLKAEDSPTHIFLGWSTSDRMSELCDDFTLDDLIVSENNVWKWDEPLSHDMIIYAIYRKRKKYRLMVSFDNRHSYFLVKYQGKTTMLSDKDRDYVEVLEGYHFVVTCCPITTKNRKENISYTYNFYKWSDGYLYQSREYLVEDSLFKDGVCRFLTVCSNEKVSVDKSLNNINNVEITEDLFVINLPEENSLGYTELPFYSTDIVSDFKGVHQVYDPDNVSGIHSYITLSNGGYIVFDGGDDMSGKLFVKLTIDATNLGLLSEYDLYFNDVNDNGGSEDGSGSEDSEYEIPIRKEGTVTFRNNYEEKVEIVDSSDIFEVICEFDNCENGTFTIETSFDDLRISNICIMQKNIVDKGLISLCIPSEDTLKFIPGVLNINGAICVDDSWYGIDSTQLGTVNKLKKIEII